MSNPMTAVGDLIVGGTVTGGVAAPTRLALGASNTRLASDSVNDLWVPSMDIAAGTGVTITSSQSGGLITKTIAASASGGSGVTMQFPSLKPATPTDDFAAATLSGSWSAHSVSGSFGTGNVITQGEAWVGSSAELQFSNQVGTLYRTHADADLDFTIGGLRWHGANGQSAFMFGIAALNTSGSGIGVVVYNDGAVYLALITTYGYVSNSAVLNHAGINQPYTGGGSVHAGDWWLRLKRISGTWTGYFSNSGRTWDKTFATRSDVFVVAQLHWGILYENFGGAITGRLSADYYQLDT